MGVPKTSDHIQIKVQMPNPSQEPPVSSNAPNEVSKDIDLLCTLKIKLESQKLEYRGIKDHCPYQIKIKMQNPSQEPPASIKAPNKKLKDIDILCSF